jgi:uncharacterized protein (TIGR02452 family)
MSAAAKKQDEGCEWLSILPCLDSPAMGQERRWELDIDRAEAARLGQTAVAWSRQGWYPDKAGRQVSIAAQVARAVSLKQSLAPDARLPEVPEGIVPRQTRVQVSNETTFQAARRLIAKGSGDAGKGKVLALNFANGISAGGGFLHGARAQEEVLCRSSAFYLTLVGDPMYDYHRGRSQPDSSSWCILSPEVPVFREDRGTTLDEPWLLSFITCAAPVAPRVGRELSAVLLRERMQRVYSIARAFGYENLVLGAWGCGAFGNDIKSTARSFRELLVNYFATCFSEVVFAVTDWSEERRFLGAFQDEFDR